MRSEKWEVKQENDLSKRLYNFALKIVLLVRTLPKEIAAHEIGRQLIRSGTSITANYEEAKGAFSKDDFTYKLNTAFKEARETNLWLRLLNDSKIMKDEQLNEVIKESEEIRNILGKGVKTAKHGNKN
ncbi:MAG: four helix bundle protein [Nitrospirae bacterium]|nr:four helix bundle protein [Nitrospirota bacterium]